VNASTQNTKTQSNTDHIYDLIVVGAGVNGLGIARDAALRGLSVALVEKEDIGSGTSSWSGRLVHGGLRYLEQGDIRLVRESLREREILFRLAPHIVKPVPLMMPFYKHNARPNWMIRVAMLAYDVLSFDKSTVNHKILSRKTTIARFPNIGLDGLTGSAVFMDGQVVWSERLCAEIALSAVRDGVHLFTYAKVDGFLHENNRIVGISYQDQLTHERHILKSKLVVNAAGPWVDHVLNAAGLPGDRLIGGAKGSHLILNPFPGAPKDVVYYESRADGRLVLIIPWGDKIMIGTTDTKYDHDPDIAQADAVEISYLLGEVNQLIPMANLTPDDVLYTYSGVRPLPYVPATNEWKVPRSHIIQDHGPDHDGLYSIIGGKLTTYRSLAHDTMKVVFKALKQPVPKCRTHKIMFPGALGLNRAQVLAMLSDLGGLGAETCQRLVDIYGVRAAEIAKLCEQKPDLKQVFDPETGAIGAELIFTYDTEFCRTLTDVVIRRVMVGYNSDCGQHAVLTAADILAQHLGWDTATRQTQIDRYFQYIARYGVRPVGDLPGTQQHHPS